MKVSLRLLRYGLYLASAGALLGLLGGLGAYLFLSPSLPSTDTLKDVQLQVPLRVFSADNQLIAEFGEKKRIPLHYAQFPKPMVNALLAAEDDRFFEHPGVDYQGLIRAAIHLLMTGEKGQGGSTITMQVARNFFLSSEKTYLRKLSEILLALKIEKELSKEEILELYLNKIYLGQRSYGFAAAAHVYYGKPLSELNVAQFAMLAGLPKAPSAYNPVVNPSRALLRRNYVLRRMTELGFLEEAQFQEAMAEPVTASLYGLSEQLEALYVAEMVRAEMVQRYGSEAYTEGLQVYTTLDSRLQSAANEALRGALLEYDRRHGYRGPEGSVALPEAAIEAGEETAAGNSDNPEEQTTASALYQEALSAYPPIGKLVAGLVLEVTDAEVSAYTQQHGTVQLPLSAMAWAAPYLNENAVGSAPQKPSELLKRGDIIRLRQLADGAWELAQVPQVGGALVSLRPRDGALLALVGGFDFFHSKFNRVTQAERQPGSNFKPFIYSAALEKGFTPASMINDAPVVFEDTELEAEWRPENYSGRFYGPTRLREALVRSRNLVSIRLLRSIGIPHALGYLKNFGFDTGRLPRDLSLSLGSGTVTPWELVRAYAVFANGGYLVRPHFIERIEDSEGKVLHYAVPTLACEDCADLSAEPLEEAEAVTETPTDESSQGEEQHEIVALATEIQETAPEQTEELVRPLPEPAPRTLEARNVYLITTMMQDVIRRGTGQRALQLGRNDLAGKTGTTNEQRDAWFSGFNPEVVATAWVGFDTPQPLGNRETGAAAALPMWIEYMREALKDVPEQPLTQPPGLVTVRIDAETGLLAHPGTAEAVFETFRSENVPQRREQAEILPAGPDQDDATGLTEQLF